MIVAWTGHRPDLFRDPQAAEKAVHAAAREMVQQGAERFVIGGQRGVDTWAADAAIELAIPFTLIVPLTLDEFTRDWTEADRAALQEFVAEAAEVLIAGGYTERNRELVRRADLLVAIWTQTAGGGTAETIESARRAGKPLHEIVLEPSSMAQSAGGRGI